MMTLIHPCEDYMLKNVDFCMHDSTYKT